MDKGINIVHYWGGAPIVPNSKWLRTLKLIEQCDKNGWNNWLVLSQPIEQSLIQPYLDAGCEIIYQPRSKGNFDLSSVIRNFKLLKRLNCTLFHCNNDHTSPMIAAALAGVPVKIWSKLAMSSYYENNTEAKGLRKLFPSLRVTTFFSDKVLAISHAVKDELIQQIGFANKIDVINAPVPTEKYLLASKVGIREAFNFADDDIVITAVGHSVKVKGWDIAIKAFALVADKAPNATLLLVGKHTSLSFHQKLNELISSLGLQDRVMFSGARSDVDCILKASDIFIFPSRSEGVGAALIEAQAAGLPCVASNTGGIPEVIEDGVNGFLFQRENYEQLANKVNSLISDPDLRTQFSQAAQQNLAKYTIERYVNNVAALYKKLLKMG